MACQGRLKLIMRKSWLQAKWKLFAGTGHTKFSQVFVILLSTVEESQTQADCSREDEGNFLPFQASNLVKALDVLQQICSIVGLSQLDLEGHSACHQILLQSHACSTFLAAFKLLYL